MKATVILGNASAGAAAKRREAQDLSRHKPLARAAHLSPAEITKRDAAMVEHDVEQLGRVQATRPLKPPGRRA